MTPQESQLVEDLFDRLAKLETLPRDPAAERLIAEGAQYAPHALYALVQTALLQDEALRRANARIEELQAQADAPQAQPDERQTSFLDSVRQAFGGSPQQQTQQRGSVPSVRAGIAPQDDYQAQTPPPNYGAQPGQAAQPGYVPQMPPPGYGPPPFGGGGSFLGTAASSAAGVIGGALLLDGIRSMFGHRSGFGQSAFGAVPENRSSPWTASNDRNTGGSAADSDLARQAGIDHIGDAARNDANTAGTTDNVTANNVNAFTNNNDDNNWNDDSDNEDEDEDDNSDFGDDSSDSGGSSDV
jgi:uncharacterized protein